jgi:hypothetical protein
MRHFRRKQKLQKSDRRNFLGLSGASDCQPDFSPNPAEICHESALTARGAGLL